MVVLHFILFVGVLAADLVHRAVTFVSAHWRVYMQIVAHAFVRVECRLFAVVVRREDLGEGVAHLELAVEGRVELRAHWV